MIASVGLLAYALVTRQAIIATVGAIVYVLGLAIGLRATVRAARAYRAGVEIVWSQAGPRGLTEHITSALNGAILFGGLIAFMIGGDDGDRGVFRAGAIIWIGGIAIWFISGIIVREVAGIPLRMGYGGWHIYRPRRGRSR
jgi:hypothetical protein